jgi:hypothetical protein
VIPAISVPMSLIGTFMVLYVLGYTLDNLSLMALIIAVGFVVDGALPSSMFRTMFSTMTIASAGHQPFGRRFDPL